MVRRNNQKENARRRGDTKKRRADKLMIAYIKNKYPAVYKEGAEFYEKLNRQHPDKIDLTKAPEFVALTKTAGSSTTILQLEIELMDKGQVEKTRTRTTMEVVDEASQPIPPVAAQPVINQHSEPLEQDEMTQPIPPVAAQVVIGQHSEPDLQLLPLDQDEMDTLVNDLLQDPDVSDWFSNFQFECDNCPLW